MARGGCTLVGMMLVRMMPVLMAAGLLTLAALALLAPSSAHAHAHPITHAQAAADGAGVADADHVPPADDACGGKHGLSCGGTCPMMLAGVTAGAPFPAPPLRATAPFRPSAPLPEGIDTLPALKPPRMPV